MKVYSGKVDFTSSLFSSGILLMSTLEGAFKLENVIKSDPKFETHSESM